MQEEFVAKMRKYLMNNGLPLVTSNGLETFLLNDGCEPAVKWQHYDGKDPVKGVVYKGTSLQYENVWKLECLVQGVNAQTLYRHLAAMENECWVPHVYRCQTNAKGEDWTIIQQIARGMLSIADRETLLIRFDGEKVPIKGTDFFYQIWCSIDDEMYPTLNSKSVRAHVYPGGIGIKSCVTDSNSCYLTYVHNVDLKGHFPRWLAGVSSYKLLQRFTQAVQREGDAALQRC